MPFYELFFAAGGRKKDRPKRSHTKLHDGAPSVPQYFFAINSDQKIWGTLGAHLGHNLGHNLGHSLVDLCRPVSVGLSQCSMY